MFKEPSDALRRPPPKAEAGAAARGCRPDIEAIVHWEPGPGQRGLLLAASLSLVVSIGALHALTGPRFEFHVFFLLPVIVAAWYAGVRIGLFTTLVSLLVWVLIDRYMAPGRTDLVAAVFNDVARLSVLLIVVGLTARLRTVLRREAASARVDPLTQLANRRLFYEQGRIEIARARRLHQPFTVILLDLDDFKQVNDRQGHRSGDELLRAVAETLKRCTRASDVAGRLGGDEFAILMPDTGPWAAHTAASKLRMLILERVHEHRWAVTASMGVATFAVPPDDLDALVSRADALMYEVKRQGKNTIRHEVYGAAS